jgi:hypothetical protein
MGHSLRLLTLSHLTMAICRFRRRSPPSPPLVALVDLAPTARSAPARPRWGFCSSSRRLLLGFRCLTDWMECLQPLAFLRCGVVLGRLAVGKVLLRHRRSPLDDGVAPPQPWLHWQCRCPGLLPAPLQAHMWVIPYLLCPYVHCLVTWPVSQACLPAVAMLCLILWLDSRIPMLASTCCCC